MQRRPPHASASVKHTSPAHRVFYSSMSVRLLGCAGCLHCAGSARSAAQCRQRSQHCAGRPAERGLSLFGGRPDPDPVKGTRGIAGGAREGMTGDHRGSGDWRARHADFPGWGVCGCRGRIVGTPNSPVLFFPSSPSTPASERGDQLLLPATLPYPRLIAAAITPRALLLPLASSSSSPPCRSLPPITSCLCRAIQYYAEQR